MHYVVEINNSKEHKVELTEDDRGVWSATVGDDRQIDLELRGRDEDGAFVVLVDGEERRFHLDQDATNCYLTDDRDMMNVNVDQAGEVVLDHAETERRGELDLGSVESPMTGVTVEVLVDEGDEVDEGSPVMIVEAMKMENTVSAPVGGVIEQVNVTSGDRVFTGDELLKINRRPGE